MKQFCAFALIFAIFYGSLPLAALAQTQTRTTSTLPQGCQAGDKFSRTTGLPCEIKQEVALPEGCQPGDTFSATTGLACDSKVTTTTHSSSTQTENETSNSSSGVKMDHFASAEAARAAFKANEFVCYLPTRLAKTRNLSSNERVRGLPNYTIVDGVTRDRQGLAGENRNFVILCPGFEVVYQYDPKTKTFGPMSRMKICDNDIYSSEEISLQSYKKTTTNNTTTNNTYNQYSIDCKDTKNSDGTTTLECGKAKLVIRDGIDGSSCRGVVNADNTLTISCDNSEPFTVRNGKDGKDGWCAGLGCKIVVVIIILVVALLVFRCLVQKKCGGLVEKMVPPKVETLRIGPGVVTKIATD